MTTRTLIGIGLGSASIIAVAVAYRNRSNRAIHLSQTQTVNNAGLVLYDNEVYTIEEILQQTSDFDLTAYEAQQEIAANSRTGETLELAIKQITRIRGDKTIIP